MQIGLVTAEYSICTFWIPGARSFIFVAQNLSGKIIKAVTFMRLYLCNCMMYTDREFCFQVSYGGRRNKLLHFSGHIIHCGCRAEEIWCPTSDREKHIQPPLNDNNPYDEKFKYKLLHNNILIQTISLYMNVMNIRHQHDI